MAYLAFVNMSQSSTWTKSATVSGSASVDVEIRFGRATGSFRHLSSGGTQSFNTSGAVTVKLSRGSTTIETQTITNYLSSHSGSPTSLALAESYGRNLANFSTYPSGYDLSFDFDVTAGQSYTITIANGGRGLVGDEEEAWNNISDFASVSWSMPTATFEITPTSATIPWGSDEEFEAYISPSGNAPSGTTSWSLTSGSAHAYLTNSSGRYTNVVNDNNTANNQTAVLRATNSSYSSAGSPKTANITLSPAPLAIYGPNKLRYGEEGSYYAELENGVQVNISSWSVSPSTYAYLDYSGADAWVENMNDTTTQRTVQLRANRQGGGYATKTITLEEPKLTGLTLISYTNPLNIDNNFAGTIVVRPEPAGLVQASLIEFVISSSNTSYISTGTATQSGNNWNIPITGYINCYDEANCPTITITCRLRANTSISFSAVINTTTTHQPSGSTANFSPNTGRIKVRPNMQVMNGSFRRGQPYVFNGSWREAVEVYTFNGSWRRNKTRD